MHAQPPAQHPHIEKPGSHRVPVIPVAETPEIEAGGGFLNIAITLVILAAMGGGFWYFSTHRSSQTGPIPTQGPINDIAIRLESASSAMVDEEARIFVKLSNTSVWQRTVGVGVIDDGVFEASGARRIVDLSGKDTQTLSLPFSAHSRGSWVIRVGLYDEHNTLIGTASQPLAVVDAPLRVRLDLGEKALIRVPKSGRIFGVLRYEATSTIGDAEIHITSSPDRQIALHKLRAGSRGAIRVSTLVAPALRGQTVHVSDLNLSVRTTWIDVNANEHAIRSKPAPDQIRISAFARLYDARGKMMSDGPLPLSAETPSTFWVNLGVSRDTRDVHSVLMQAKLAPGVEFTGKTWVNNGDKFSYDADARMLIWQTHPLRKTDKNEPTVGFEVRLTPSKDSVGTLPEILSSIIADRKPGPDSDHHDIETGPVVTDFRFDRFAAPENAVRK